MCVVKTHIVIKSEDSGARVLVKSHPLDTGDKLGQIIYPLHVQITLSPKLGRQFTHRIR